MKNLFHSLYVAPFGELALIYDEDTIYSLSFGADRREKYLDAGLGRGKYHLVDAELAGFIKSALDDYFNGAKTAFDHLKTQTFGTDFQQQAWAALKTIPYGKTISYQEEAARAGNIKAVRAIGGANNKNPIAIIIPCHRVIGKNGKMVGFGGGLAVKEWLLQHEKSL